MTDAESYDREQITGSPTARYLDDLLRQADDAGGMGEPSEQPDNVLYWGDAVAVMVILSLLGWLVVIPALRALLT
jgi:hypothetical protein